MIAEDWDPETAPARLREAVADPETMRVMAARVKRAQVERPSSISRRASMTLDFAINGASDETTKSGTVSAPIVTASR